MSARPRVLVAGVGNIFLGDDGFGVEVARRLAGTPVPDGVEVADVGIRGVHLAYRLLDGYHGLVLVDTVARGGEPGTVYVLDPDAAPDTDPETGPDAGTVPLLDAHAMDPQAVLALVKSLGGHVDRTRVVGCEPADVTEGIGLSEPVANAVDAAATTAYALARDLLAESGTATSPAPATDVPHSHANTGADI